jgi:hypothetical protein
MDTVSDSEYPRRTGNVRILTSQEELAEAISRAQEYERQNTELLAARAQRHGAALTRSSDARDSRPWHN